MGKKRNPSAGSSAQAIQARQREERAVEMRLAGGTLEEIAAELGYASHEGARMAIIRAKARLSPIENIEELRRQEVATTYEVQQEAWEQWKRSTEDAVKETVKTSLEESEDDAADGIEKEKTVAREGQTGNPALLDKVLKAMERRAKLLGLDAPERLDVNAGVRVIGQQPDAILETALARLKKRNQDAAGN
jgi:hypothetical protein